MHSTRIFFFILITLILRFPDDNVDKMPWTHFTNAKLSVASALWLNKLNDTEKRYCPSIFQIIFPLIIYFISHYVARERRRDVSWLFACKIILRTIIITIGSRIGERKVLNPKSQRDAKVPVIKRQEIICIFAILVLEMSDKLSLQSTRLS